MPFKNMQEPKVTNGPVDTTEGREGYGSEFDMMEEQLDYQQSDPNWRADEKGRPTSEPIAYEDVGGRKSFKLNQ